MDFISSDMEGIDKKLQVPQMKVILKSKKDLEIYAKQLTKHLRNSNISFQSKMIMLIQNGLNDKTCQRKRICNVINEMNDTNSLIMANLPETLFRGSTNIRAQ